MFGRTHPVFGGDDILAIDGDGLIAFEDHLTRRDRVADLFYKADTKSTITSAQRARDRIVVQPQIGSLVCYYRRQKGTRYQAPRKGYRGPAR
eukprot:11176071-Lingulodinium_polyedra.AAC.1